MFFTLPLPIGHRSKLELPSPNANNYLHIDPRYLSALITPSPSDVTMDSPSPVEIAASIDVPDAVVLRKNLQNAAGGGGLDEIREQFVNVISNNADNGNVKHVSRAAYPGQAKQIIASATGVARIVDEVGALDEPMAKSQPGLSSEEGRRSTVDSVAGKASIGQREVSDFRSKTEIIDVDLGSNDDHEIIVKISSCSSELASNEDRRLMVDDITRDKTASNLRSKAEIVDVDLGSSELMPRECSRSIIKSAVKGKTEIGQKDVLDLRSKMEIADVDLDSIDDRELMMKIQSGESSSGELRLGECCWPKREGAANDEVEAHDRKIISEKKIIAVELGLDDKNALKETCRSMVEAINDEVSSGRSSFSKIGSEKSPRSMVKSVVDGKIDVNNKEIVDIEVEFPDVVKVQPVHSSHGILSLKEDRRLMIEKLTNELKIKLDEEKNKSKESSQVDKIGKDTKLTELSAKDDMNVEVDDDAGIDSRKETADFEFDRTKYLEAKATSSLNISMTSLDGRYECALSDFSVDKEDYRLSQYGSDEDEEEKKKPVYTARLNLTKYADGQIEDVTDSLTDFVNESNIRKSDVQSYSGQVVLSSAMIPKSQKEESFTEEIDNRAKSFEETDQLKYVMEESFSMAEVDDKDYLEGGERTEEIFKMSREADKSRTEKRSELDTHSSEKRVTSCDSNLEIDGKYLKSIVNSRKSPRKIREGQVYDVEVKEQYRFIDDPQALQSVAFQSSSTKMKSFEKVKQDQTYVEIVDFEEKDQSAKNREMFRAEKAFQDSSRSSSMKTRSPRKVEVLQTDESEREMKDHDRSINDRDTSRSRKGSQKSSKVFTSAKSPKKKSQVFYRSEDYDRSINDRVISQLEEVFLDSSKKSSVKIESPKKDFESELKKQNRHADNREMSRTEELSQHSSRTSSTKSPKKTQIQKAVKMNDNQGQVQEAIKMAKNSDNKTKCDFNEIKDVYTRKVRRYNVPLQGSLDSMIVSDETSAQKPKKDDTFSKKSKSYESIKRIQEVFLGVPPTKANSSGSQLDIPDEFCSICCYMNEITFRTEEEVSSPNQETFYTLRSTCSSLADDDSIECDICLQESANDLEGKIQEIPCEICTICGEVDGSFDQDSTIPADRYTFKMIEPHQDDDDSFEIENCGFQSGTESADDRSRVSDKEKVKDPGRSKSQSLFIHGSSMNRDQPRELYFIPKDEIAILTSGAKKVNRKGSLFRKKEDFSGNARDKRRYSSVDSLQLAKMAISKASDKVLKVAKNAIGSADNLRMSRDSRRSKSLQRSADGVDRLNKSTDNLNSQTENLGKENEAEDSAQKLNTRDKEEVKMILTQHGIKIISEKETAL